MLEHCGVKVFIDVKDIPQLEIFDLFFLLESGVLVSAQD